MHKLPIWALPLAGTIFLVLCLVGIAVVGFVQGKESDWWSAWGQWFGGAATFFAAVTALWIAWHTWREAERERVERTLILPRLVSTDYLLDERRVVIENLSGGTITKVCVMRIDASDPTDGQWDTEFPLGQTAFRVLKAHSADTLSALYLNSDGKAVNITTRPTVTIRFVDPDGRLWERTGSYEPLNVSAGPA